jgi:hypothetical protein
MKPNKYIMSLLAGATLATPAFGLTFEITGATAFRTATIKSIHALYVASGQPFRFCHNRATEGDYINADFLTFEGTITGYPGTTVIRCAFNGSVEGVRALAQSPAADPSYYKLSVLTEAATVGGTNMQAIPTSGNLETAESEMAFSDVDKAITPYAANTTLTGGPVGVVVFGLVSSEGSSVTNVTTQQYNSLLGNGYMPLSYFTGVAADDNRLIFCTGRNDGSGTRSSYMAEMGYGVANAVQQYLVVGSEGNQITAIQNVPAGGINGITPGPGGSAGDIDAFDAQPIAAGFQDVSQLTTSASTVWGQDIPGNGGAFSGSLLRGHLGLDGDSVTVFDADGFDLFGSPQANIGLVSYISLNDAVTARAAGATLCSFNGVSLAVTDAGNTEMTAADKSKVYEGTYSAWNFQQLYRKTTASAETIALYASIAGAIPTNLGSAGLTTTAMQCARSNDGGIINPQF